MSTKAIQTRYKGYHFRSRLEARWAVFFDAIGLEWEYEPEGFELPSGEWYLPDFRVIGPQGMVTWYEIKPKHITKDSKFDEFCHSFSHDEPVMKCGAELLSGDPYDEFSRWFGGIDDNDESFGMNMCPRCGSIHFHEHWVGNGEIIITCYSCDADTPCGSGHSPDDGVAGDKTCEPYKGSVLIKSFDYCTFRIMVKNAAAKARSARFEHGETGQHNAS